MAGNTMNSPQDLEREARIRPSRRNGSQGRGPTTPPPIQNTRATTPAGEEVINPTPVVEQPPIVEQRVAPAPVMAYPQSTAQSVNPAIATHDRVRWGPVWGGVLTTFTSFLVLETLAYALGILNPNNANEWITGIIGLIAFFLGGWIAEATSAARGGGAGLLNGFMVWALAITLILALSIFGLSALFGALGNVAGSYAANGRSINPGIGVSSGTIASVSHTAAWGAFLALIVSAIAAMFGGLISSHGNPIGRMARERTND